MIKYLRLLLMICIFTTASVVVQAQDTQTVPPQVSSEDSAKQQMQQTLDVQQALNIWLTAISSGSSDAVVKLYARDAVLLPTLSPKIDATPESRKEYFDAFTAKPNLKGAVSEEHVQIFGNIAINSGFYTFTYTQDGKTVKVPARFSFVYRKTPQGWLIIDHHSSKLPAAH